MKRLIKSSDTTPKAMKTKLIIASCGAAFACGALLGLWYWQANHAERVMNISVPRWLAGDWNVSYSIAVGKSQIKPYGTVWKMTVGDGWTSLVPICDDKDLERYLARHKKK